MRWLNEIVDELISRHPEGEIVVSSGVSPSGTYHIGTMREVLTAEAVARELRNRGRDARHLHIVDDLDVFRKVPKNVPESFEKYLGMPLCDIPSPSGSGESYADYYLSDLIAACKAMDLSVEIIRAHEKYRQGFFSDAIEKSVENVEKIRSILQTVSGHKLDDSWSPIQVVEDGYIKNRPVTGIDAEKLVIDYLNPKEEKQSISYEKGNVKLNWRIDWPARWWLLNVHAEPFGRDHATKGGSYDTGCEIVKKVFGSEPPLPVPYNFINRTGDTKKMSKSSGDVITAAELLELLPPEVVWYFILRYSPDKQLFFDEGETLIRLVDDFGALLAKDAKTEDDEQLLKLCLQGVSTPTISRVPFSLLVSSYQAALKDVDKTLEIISRSEYRSVVEDDPEIIKSELAFIRVWLEKKAPEEVKFELLEQVVIENFTQQERDFLTYLSEAIEQAPKDADGNWFHQTIYAYKDRSDIAPKELFSVIYKVLIGKLYGPRAGWFLSILPRDWLVDRLSFRK